MKVAEIKADLDALKTSQGKGATLSEPLWLGIKVDREGELTTLSSFDGISSTRLIGRDWGVEISEGGFILPASFANIIANLRKDDDVRLIEGKGQLEIRQGRSKWRLPLVKDCSAFYPLGDDVHNGTEGTCLELDSDLLREAIVNVFPSIGKDYTAYCSAQLIFSIHKGELTAVATDLKRSTVWQALNIRYPALSTEVYTLTLPGGKLLALAKFLKSNQGKIDLCFTPGVCIFESKENKSFLAIRLIDGRNYPPIVNLFTLPIQAVYSIEPKELLSAFKRIKVLLPSNKLAGSSTISLTFKTGESTETELTVGNETDLFTEVLSAKPVEIDGKESPKSFNVELNLDYLQGALNLLSTAGSCEIGFSVNEYGAGMAKITGQTLEGTITHFVGTINRQEQLKP